MAKGKGIDWKDLNTASLSKEIKKKYDEYDAAVEMTKNQAKLLSDALKKEWQAKFPKGKDGQKAAFKVFYGTVQYAMVDVKEEAETDDIFAP